MDKNLSFKINVEIESSREKVWNSLTNPEIIKKYLFNTNAKSDWEIGSDITFEGEHEGRHYKDKGSITNIRTNELLQYTYWSGFAGLEDIPENYSLLTFQLEGRDNKTTLTLSQQGFVNTKAKQHSESNWKIVLLKLKELTEHLE
jgi:uncharacterized protein YndB with AHSA1/START domain